MLRRVLRAEDPGVPQLDDVACTDIVAGAGGIQITLSRDTLTFGVVATGSNLLDFGDGDNTYVIAFLSRIILAADGRFQYSGLGRKHSQKPGQYALFHGVCVSLDEGSNPGEMPLKMVLTRLSASSRRS